MASIHPLRRYRETHDLTLNELAKRLKTTGMTVWRWETSRRTPRPPTAFAIEERIGVPASEILAFRKEGVPAK